MTVTLKSRIPEIIARLPGKVDEAMQGATEKIAHDAADRAPVSTGELQDSIEARDGDQGYGIYALWRWFFTEFGTVDSGAQPYMVPAWEAGKDDLLKEVENALEDL